MKRHTQMQAIATRGKLSMEIISSKGDRNPFFVDIDWNLFWPGLAAIISWFLVPVLLGTPQILKEIFRFIDFIVMSFVFVYLFHDVMFEATRWAITNTPHPVPIKTQK